MNLSDPTQAVTPTLDGAVLAVLARSEQELTVAQVAALAPRGTAAGVRKVLYRLGAQGIVTARVVGSLTTYQLNDDHVAATVAGELAGLWGQLWRRLRELVAGWALPPVYAAVFGSAARRDGDETSDLDVLVVRPDDIAGDDAAWEQQLDRLRDRGTAWSGNQVSILELSEAEARAAARRGERLLREAEREGVGLTDGPVPWRRPRSGAA